MQSFGTYEDADEAAAAYDLGYILFRGTRGKINCSIDTYIEQATGRFHAAVAIPEQVLDAVDRFFTSDKFMHHDRAAVALRMAALFPAGATPPVASLWAAAGAAR